MWWADGLKQGNTIQRCRKITVSTMYGTKLQCNMERKVHSTQMWWRAERETVVQQTLQSQAYNQHKRICTSGGNVGVNICCNEMNNRQYSWKGHSLSPIKTWWTQLDFIWDKSERPMIYKNRYYAWATGKVPKVLLSKLLRRVSAQEYLYLTLVRSLRTKSTMIKGKSSPPMMCIYWSGAYMQGQCKALPSANGPSKLS